MGTINLTDPQAGTQIVASLVTNNNTALETAINGGLDETNFASGAIYTLTKLKQGGGTTGQVLAWSGSAWAPTNPQVLTGHLLGQVSYNPTTVTQTTTTSGTLVDIDASNLVVTVTVPASGKILVHFSAGTAASFSPSAWGLRESSTPIASTKVSQYDYISGARISMLMIVTGLSAGSHTYKWGQSSVSGATVGIRYGTQASPAAADPGPALMAIWGAP
jgi:hypothetical protein